MSAVHWFAILAVVTIVPFVIRRTRKTMLYDLTREQRLLALSFDGDIPKPLIPLSIKGIRPPQVVKDEENEEY